MTDSQTGVRTFLIADVRGYSRFTEEYGDEAAARLASKFADVAAEEIDAHGGRIVEIRGDEALAVFTSARQAIRAGVALQHQFDVETEANSDLPLRVGVGIDSGEAVPLENGSFRGAALNVAARLCGRAHGGEVLVSESTSRLSGRLAGLQYVDQGRVRLKNIPDPIHIFKVYSELDAVPGNRWVVMFFGKQPGRTLGWKLGAFVALIAVVSAVAVVYLTTNDQGNGSDRVSTPHHDHRRFDHQPDHSDGGDRDDNAEGPDPGSALERLQAADRPRPEPLETAVCVPPSGAPDRWQISSYPNGSQLTTAYTAELRRHPAIARDTGKCNAFSWGGERPWLHGPGKPGGRVFCYFDGDDAVIVWTHARLGQPNHRDVLAIASESGSDHASLTHWWRPWHHRIGKAG